MPTRESFDIDGLMVFRSDLTAVDQDGNTVASVITPDKYVQSGKEPVSDEQMGRFTNTTAYWNAHSAYIPKKGEVIIYSDGGSITEGGTTVYIPKIKIGDGTTTVVNLPFTDSDTQQGIAGTLNTTNTAAQTPVASESLSGNVNLHKVSKTGNYDDLLNKPTIPTVPTHRTVNHEQITDSSLGDANLHDGFYFPNAVQDYDGNWYGAVVIGDQVWLGENLRTTHYNNGDEIPLYTKNTDGSVGRYYPGSGNNGYALTPHPELVPVFGYLYSNQLAQNEINEDYYSIEKTISPSGFHIPSSGDFNNLRNYIKNNKRYILNDNNLKIGKSLASTDYWNTSSTDYAVGNDLTQNNKTGFNAKPTGYVPASTGWGAASAFEKTYFMNTYKSSSNGLYVSAISSDSASFGAWTMGGNPGLAVRCVSNLTPLQFRDWYIKQYGSLQHHLPEELGVPIITFRYW